jgi:hypothetical protein
VHRAVAKTQTMFELGALWLLSHARLYAQYTLRGLYIYGVGGGVRGLAFPPLLSVCTLYSSNLNSNFIYIYIYIHHHTILNLNFITLIYIYIQTL